MIIIIIMQKYALIRFFRLVRSAARAYKRRVLEAVGALVQVAGAKGTMTYIHAYIHNNTMIVYI